VTVALNKHHQRQQHLTPTDKPPQAHKDSPQEPEQLRSHKKMHKDRTMLDSQWPVDVLALEEVQQLIHIHAESGSWQQPVQVPPQPAVHSCSLRRHTPMTKPMDANNCFQWHCILRHIPQTMTQGVGGEEPSTPTATARLSLQQQEEEEQNTGCSYCHDNHAADPSLLSQFHCTTHSKSTRIVTSAIGGAWRMHKRRASGSQESN
jgi:hypothetical protein